ncbi:MAG TPA: PP2C family protein-serine/threonine phosphatase [Bacteroidales bacterium]|nr:PP2C family protein-serine/threonine phosphatase [Bacteroidales bacterium]
MAKSLSKAKVSTFKLNALLDITLAINNNEPIKELAGRLKKILTIDLMIGKVMIIKNGESPECILNSGFSDDFYQELDIEDHLQSYKEISFITSDPGRFKERVDIVMPVLEKDEPIAYVLIGDIDEEGEGMSPILKHLRYIQTLANIIIVAIENKRLFEESLRQEALNREMELASRMQSMLIPEKEQLPCNDCIKMYAFYHPHFDVGGDYYDVIKLNEDEFGFCIADVSGKGISAAILMSNFQANLQALFTDQISLEELIERLNKRVIDSAKGEKFITLFLGRYNCKTRELKYVNAGHNPPILYRMKSNTITHLKNGAVGMGMLDELPFLEVQSVTMDEASKMLCFTDGLVEIINDSEVETGTEKLEIELQNDDSIKKNIDAIIKKQGILEDDDSIFDDISILSAEFPG